MGCGGGGGGCSYAAAGGAFMEGTRKMSGSNGMRMAGCKAFVTNLASTSSVAESEAAEVWARSIEGNALLARLLAHADTMSLTAWCSSSAVRWIFSRLSRSVRDTACSTAFGSAAIPVRLQWAGPHSDYRNHREVLSTPHRTGVSACAHAGGWRSEDGGPRLRLTLGNTTAKSN